MAVRGGLALTIVATLVLPLVAADQAQDSAIGANLGLVAPGQWDMFRFAAAGGPTTLALSWVEPTVCLPRPYPCIFADYDLRLYVPNAFADGDFDDHELVAHSSRRPYAHHSERIDVTLAPGSYWVVVAPFQSQAEKYTLQADPGTLTNSGWTFGYQTHKP